jgi:hypothetical protein
MGFFTAHEKNLLAAEAPAGVRHHVALSIVGADRSPDNGYFRAKIVQEDLIKVSGIPYTIIRSTQFMEFLGAIADAGQGDGVVNIATGLFQQMTSPPSWPRWRYLRHAGPGSAREVAKASRFIPSAQTRRFRARHGHNVARLAPSAFSRASARRHGPATSTARATRRAKSRGSRCLFCPLRASRLLHRGAPAHINIATVCHHHA